MPATSCPAPSPTTRRSQRSTSAGPGFHLETFGSPEDPPIVFLHGGPGGDYRRLLRLRVPVATVARLEDDHLLVFWDQRGAGLSERLDADEIDLEAYLADLDAMLDRFAGGRPPVLIGHSWGAMYATAYLDRSPHRVAAAVLLEPGPLTGPLYDEIKGEMIQIDVASEWTNDFLWAQRFLSADDHARLDYAPLTAMEHAQPGYHQSTTDPMPIWRLGTVAQNAVLASGTTEGVPTWDFVAHARDFTGPVHLVASGDNTVLGVDFQARQADFFAAPTLTVIADAGHDFPWTRPAETLAAIYQTLAQLDP